MGKSKDNYGKREEKKPKAVKGLKRDRQSWKNEARNWTRV